MLNRLRRSSLITADLLGQVMHQLDQLQEPFPTLRDRAIHLAPQLRVRRILSPADPLWNASQQLKVVTIMHSLEAKTDEILGNISSQLDALEDILKRLADADISQVLFGIVRQLLPQADFWSQLNQLKTLTFPQSEITLLDALVQKYLKVEMPSPNHGLSFSFSQCSTLSDACPLVAAGLLGRFNRLNAFSFAYSGYRLYQLNASALKLSETILNPPFEHDDNLELLISPIDEIIGEIAVVQARLNAARDRFKEILVLYSYPLEYPNDDDLQMRTFLSHWSPFVADFGKKFLDTLTEATVKYNAEQYLTVTF